MLGLTLEGGASRSIYSAGVMDALLEEGIMADVIVGVSAGISFATSYASKQKGRTLDIALKYFGDKRYLGIRHLLNPKNRSLYNLDFVFYEIPEHLAPFDYDAFAAYEGKIFGVLTDLETGEAIYPEIPRDDHTGLYLRASCALPIMFPSFNINGREYMDGGIVDSIPYKKAMEEGCDKNIVVLTREDTYRKTTDKGTAYAAKKFKKYKAFSQKLLERADMYNGKVEDLQRLEKEGKVFIFRPDDTKGIGRTESDPVVLKRLYDKGMNDVKSRINGLREYLNK
ncbi:MAG: patatin family protein [Clostridia bacterium]|nr:patatin family protein [Clostridia bacterium]